MELAGYLARDRVILLEGDTKSAVLGEMTEVMAPALEGVTREELAEAVHRREEMMSTGIGLGIAVPHVRLDGIGDARVAVGVSRTGITDYESIDGEPVRIVVFIVAPRGRHDLYIKLLATVMELLKEPELRSRLLEARTASEVYDVLTGGGSAEGGSAGDGSAVDGSAGSGLNGGGSTEGGPTGGDV